MWKYLYDEEIEDGYENRMGILTDNENVLFYHGMTIDNKEVMRIYLSFTDLFISGEYTAEFPWSVENEEEFVNYLNSFSDAKDAIKNVDGFCVN